MFKVGFILKVEFVRWGEVDSTVKLIVWRGESPRCRYKWTFQDCYTEWKFEGYTESEWEKLKVVVTWKFESYMNNWRYCKWKLKFEGCAEKLKVVQGNFDQKYVWVGVAGMCNVSRWEHELYKRKPLLYCHYIVTLTTSYCYLSLRRHCIAICHHHYIVFRTCYHPIYTTTVSQKILIWFEEKGKRSWWGTVMGTGGQGARDGKVK